jgi:hypothetical protein
VSDGMNLYDAIARIASGDIHFFRLMSGLIFIGAFWWTVRLLWWAVTVNRV